MDKAKMLTDAMLEGLALAYPQEIELVGARLVASREQAAARPTVVAIGGAGCVPYPAGLVGAGAADVAVVGEQWAAPGPESVLEALRLADRGRGVLLVAARDEGVQLTANIALREATRQGMQASLCLACDELGAEAELRSGMAGAAVLCKLAGGAAQQEGASLEQIAALTGRAAQGMASAQVRQADAESVAAALEQCLQQAGAAAGEEVLFAVNGCGKTTLFEELCLFREGALFLEQAGLHVAGTYAGNLWSTQDGAGAEVTLVRADAEILACWQAPCRAPYFKK